MDAMMRIGDFAKLAGVSVAALRLYDEQALLQPSHVDPNSGYRSYSKDQLLRVHRIQVLKDLGFSLREIRQILQEGMRPEGFSQMLATKRDACERQVQVERQKLKRLEFQIRIIEGLQTMTIHDVKTLDVPPMLAAVISLQIPTNEQVGEVLGGAFTRIMAALESNGMSTAGPCMTVWTTSPDDVTDEIVDAVVPISKPFTPDGDVKVETLPGAFVASLTHRGPFSEFQDCHVVLKDWLAANHYRLAGPYREIYHTPPGVEAVTEVQYTIARLELP